MRSMASVSYLFSCRIPTRRLHLFNLWSYSMVSIPIVTLLSARLFQIIRFQRIILSFPSARRVGSSLNPPPHRVHLNISILSYSIPTNFLNPFTRSDGLICVGLIVFKKGCAQTRVHPIHCIITQVLLR